MIYASPVPGEMESGVFYDKTGNDYLSPDKLTADYSDTRFDRELRLFEKYCTGGAILDVGCSTGGFLYQLERRHPGKYIRLGTDISGPALEQARKMGVPILSGDFLTRSFETSFDAVTLWAVVEHLGQPAAFLRKAADILKPGGLCILLVPNMKSLAVRILGGKYRYILPEHINYFTLDTLTRLAEKEFTLIARTSTHFNPIVIWQDLRSGGRETTRTERFALLKKTTAIKRNRWAWPLKAAYRGLETVLSALFLADNLVLVCQKPLTSARKRNVSESGQV
jgi:2-polyprenyl-3-methyl-5-hydroxy-6-metoxy-1,4-benzoquinol methylase